MIDLIEVERKCMELDGDGYNMLLDQVRGSVRAFEIYRYVERMHVCGLSTEKISEIMDTPQSAIERYLLLLKEEKKDV